MRIHAISDTHGRESQVKFEKNIDILIHAGDMGTVREPIENAMVLRGTIEWLKSYPAKYKVVIAGNHDTSIERNFISKQDFTDAGIILLHHETVEIEGIKIFGSPYTPSFGEGWSYNIKHNKIANYWDVIPDDTDILVTHGPAKGILDLTESANNWFTQCGCKSLLNKIVAVEPKYHIFGHIHPETRCPNAATLKVNTIRTTFMNAAVCNLQYKYENNGHVFKY